MIGRPTLKASLGQCFWIGLNGTNINDSETQHILSQFEPGGFILFKRNIQSAAQVRKFNFQLLKSTSVRPFIAIDQEGGTVERLNEVIGSIPPAMALSASASIKLAAQVHKVHAQILAALGFNVNFNPVLDLAVGTAGNGLGTRCFSDNPDQVALYARTILKAYSTQGILGCGKHFPGLGDTNLDSHLELPVVPRRWKQIVKEDLRPYKKLLDELPFIMINHALYPELNSKLPASLAPEIVQTFLLKTWKYRGLSISDDLMMGAVSNAFNLSGAAEKALLAGNHLFLICSPSGIVDAFDSLFRRASEDRDFAELIHHNADRILLWKENFLANVSSPARLNTLIKDMAEVTEKISKRSITWIAGKKVALQAQDWTLFVPRTKWIKKPGTSINKWLRSQGKRVSEYLYEIEINADDARSLASQSKTEWNIMVVTGISHREGQKQLIQALTAAGKKVAIIHGSYPRDVIPAGVESGVASYWTAPMALEAAVAALFSPEKARGLLPFHAKKRS
jgi:beta-N-acetylhexosaminidase